MKIKHLVTVQVVLLLGAVIAGLILKTDLADGPRMAHRAIGGLAGIVSLASLVMILKNNSPKFQKLLAVDALVLSFVAGYAGKTLVTASNYDLYFNLMRVSGVLALASSVALLSLLNSSPSSAKSKK